MKPFTFSGVPELDWIRLYVKQANERGELPLEFVMDSVDERTGHARVISPKGLVADAHRDAADPALLFLVVIAVNYVAYVADQEAQRA